MRVLVTLGACAALAATSALSADFVGFESNGWAGVNTDGTTGAIGSTDYVVIDVFAQFDTNETDGFAYTDSTMLSAFGSEISMSDSADFAQNDVAGGSWDPKFSFDLPSAGSRPWVESFVLVGGDPGATNNTNLDPDFDPSTGGQVASGAGWFTGSPADLQGRVDTNLQVFVGRFAVAYNSSTLGTSLDFSADMSYNYGIGTGTFFGNGSGEWVVTPAPGALALLGLGGLAARRRRG
jgi:MYXO-CTERM domain-containing protein